LCRNRSRCARLRIRPSFASLTTTETRTHSPRRGPAALPPNSQSLSQCDVRPRTCICWVETQSRHLRSDEVVCHRGACWSGIGSPVSIARQAQSRADGISRSRQAWVKLDWVPPRLSMSLSWRGGPVGPARETRPVRARATCTRLWSAELTLPPARRTSVASGNPWSRHSGHFMQPRVYTRRNRALNSATESGRARL
jgi:hypothetical protein